MREGRIVGILDHTQATQEEIAAYALGKIDTTMPPMMEENI
jgi:hypothetical protein